MPTPTYTPLGTVTLSAPSSTITFNSISQSYRDLILVVNGRTTASFSANLILRLNSDSGVNYSLIRMYGTGSGTGTGSSATETSIYAGAIYSGFISQITINLMDYSATDKHKTALVRQDNNADTTMAVASRWASTTAVSSLACSLGSGNFTTGTSLSLYGVLA